jgi:hypothetical protein
METKTKDYPEKVKKETASKTKDYLEKVKKEAAPQSLRIVGILTGICGAHVAKKNIEFLNSLTGDSIASLAGAAGAILIPTKGNDYTPLHFAKDVACGISAYGLLSGISRLGAPVTISGIKGLGAINVPQTVKDAINKVFPQMNGLAGLGNARVIPMYPDQNGTYNMLNGNTMFLPVPNPSVPQVGVSSLGIAV